jgi:pimeloyl-ACP methyl ester carboxylesterase
MPILELSAGPIDYRDSGGGPVVVLLHGVLMDSGQWREVEQRLGSDLRLVLPTLPLGGHRRPMRPDADLSLLGQARLVAELLEALDLRDVTLGFNDWAAPQLLVAERLTARVAGMILVACETAGNYPPGLPGKNLALLGAHIRSAREGRRRLQAATGHLSSFTGPVTREPRPRNRSHGRARKPGRLAPRLARARLLGRARSPQLLIEHRANRDREVSPQIGGQRIARDQVTAHRSVGQVEDREDRSLDRRP